MPGRLAPILIAGGLLQAAFWVENDFVARVGAIARGYSVGSSAVPLFGIRWDEMWSLRLEEVRSRIVLDRARVSDQLAVTTL
jgi:ubiquinone biosynthesis protein COQ4